MPVGPRPAALGGLIVATLVIAALAGGRTAHAQSGGFVESASSTTARTPLSAAEIQAFMPDRGRFTFPSPYHTTAARLTNATDCGGGDCVNGVGYSYWSNINQHTGSATMLIVLGLDRARGGAGPTLFTYDKSTGETRNAGPLFDSTSPYSWATGEGWYFSASRPTALYMNDGPRMLRYDVSARTFETVFDLRNHLGADRYLWQMHSSADDRVHSATVKDSSTYASLGCAVYREDVASFAFVSAIGAFDECQIDKSGRWLVIKENVDGQSGEDNRIIDVELGTEQLFYDQDGAAGHSDLGHGYLVAEDNFHALPGAVRVWRLAESLTATGQGTLVYHTTSWDTGGVGHIAHGNANAGALVADQMVCSSNAHRLVEPRVNEIVCYRLDGSLNVLVVAPNMTDLDAAGGGGGDYEKQPKGNLDVSGDYFVWTTNAGTSRLDAFVVHVPRATLDGATTSSDSGTDGTTSSSGITWATLVNMTATADTLQKTGGCDGCADAHAVSEQQISGTGQVAWSAPEAQTLRVVGLSSSTTPADLSGMPFAIRLQGGYAEVREGGTYRTDVPFGAGDAFAIALDNGTVRYSKNGTVFYTSATAATTALQIHALFHDLNASIGGVAISTSGSTTSDGSTTTSDGSTTTSDEQPAPAVISLTVAGYKVKGSQKADLSWSGSAAASIDVYRNDVLITTTPNDGAYTDQIDRKGGGSYSYQVCEAGTSTCSNVASVTF